LIACFNNFRSSMAKRTPSKHPEACIPMLWLPRGAKGLFPSK
jgi:hypothetical protein